MKDSEQHEIETQQVRGYKRLLQEIFRRAHQEHDTAFLESEYAEFLQDCLTVCTDIVDSREANIKGTHKVHM